MLLFLIQLFSTKVWYCVFAPVPEPWDYLEMQGDISGCLYDLGDGEINSI